MPLPRRPRRLFRMAVTTNELPYALGVSLRKLISDQGSIADLLSRGQRQ